MGYLECLNMSAAFPFTWKAKQLEEFVRDLLSRGFMVPQVLERSPVNETPKKKCLLQTTQLKAPHIKVMFGFVRLFAEFEGGRWCRQKTSIGKDCAFLLYLQFEMKRDRRNTSETHTTKICEDKTTTFTIPGFFWLGFIFKIPTKCLQDLLKLLNQFYIMKYTPNQQPAEVVHLSCCCGF